MINEVSGVKNDGFGVQTHTDLGIYPLKWGFSKTWKNNVNNRKKTTSRFYHKNTVKLRFRRSKKVKSYVFGVQTHSEPGILSVKMKVVENTKKAL